MKLIKPATLAAISLAVSPAWADGWTFEKVNDSMTGAVTCEAISPAQYMRAGNTNDLAPVRLVVRISGDKVLTLVRVDTTRAGLLHADLSGAGVKSDPGTFHPTTGRSSQKLVAVADSGKLVDELLAAKSFRMRLRFWPYDQLVDSEPVTTQGMPAALLKASKCT